MAMRHDRREVLDYLEKHTASPEERRQTWRWVKQDHDLSDNPWLLYDDSGWPMDFISALRVIDEIKELTH